MPKRLEWTDGAPITLEDLRRKLAELRAEEGAAMPDFILADKRYILLAVTNDNKLRVVSHDANVIQTVALPYGGGLLYDEGAISIVEELDWAEFLRRTRFTPAFPRPVWIKGYRYNFRSLMTMPGVDGVWIDIQNKSRRKQVFVGPESRIVLSDKDWKLFDITECETAMFGEQV